MQSQPSVTIDIKAEDDAGYVSSIEMPDREMVIV